MCEPSYLAWCKAQGIVVHGVAPALVADRAWRGIVATQPLSPGTAVMQVPAALLMSVLSAGHDPHLTAALQQHQQQLNSHQVLALHLLHEASKGAASAWQPYILQLPQHYTNMAAWQAAAVAELQVPYACEAAATCRDNARSEWRAARPVLHALGVASKWASWPAWLWASCTLLSRTMFHPGDPDCGCLTPLGDLHNYAPPPPPFTPNMARDMARLLLAQPQPQQQQPQCCQGNQPAAQPSASSTAPQPGDPCEELPSPATSSSCQPGTAGMLPPPASPCAVPTAVLQVVPPPVPPLVPPPTPPPPCPCDSGSQQLSSPATATADKAPPCVVAAACGSADEPGAADLAAARQGHTDTLLLVALAEQQQEQGPDGAEEAGDTICGDGHFDAERGLYNIVARRSYQPGEQVFLCYGRETNLQLLELYGFLLPAADATGGGAGCNPHDAALLPPELLQQQLQAAVDAQLPRQQQQPAWQQRGQGARRRSSAAWRAVELHVPAADTFVHRCGQPSWQLLSALRLAAAPPDLARVQGYRALAGEPISLESELLVLTALAGACRAQLAALPTTQEQDAALVARLRAGGAHDHVPDACAETGAAVLATLSDDGGRGRCSVALNKCSQEDKQEAQSRLATECLVLAVQWRQTYKACLSACASHCETALALAARHS